ncbi:hypothetical protein F4860DRAFT_469914 [Xylaria cubensis]|nr:hypothetical protein F4860DRAFT_469914 [Xylaria cubensis]
MAWVVLALICDRPLLVHILQVPFDLVHSFEPARDRQSGRRTCRAVSLSSSNPIGFFISVTRHSELLGYPP